MQIKIGHLQIAVFELIAKNGDKQAEKAYQKGKIWVMSEKRSRFTAGETDDAAVAFSPC